MKTYDEIIPEFLSDDDCRQALMKPVLIEEHVFASNGHIAIKIPVSKLLKTYESNPNYPDIVSLYEKVEGLFQSPIIYKVENISELLKQVPLTDVETQCTNCQGTGSIWSKDDSKEPETCKICDGSGYVATGKKEYDWQNHKIQIGLAYFNPNYVEKLLNVATINDIKEVKHVYGTPMSKHLFIIDDLEIIMMPIRLGIKELPEYSVHKLTWRKR
ncbi:MAG: hypothetical protein PHS33_08790 [Candidatus Omnitrophica bacterium]|jgi:hypothetical protein|nr:hypothetical protein [Candidatus Omnitrophota bacterium]